MNDQTTALALVPARPALDKCCRDGLTIFKRYAGAESAYYHKLTHRGRQHMLKLHVTAEESFKLAKKMRAEIKAGRFELVDQVLAAVKERHAVSPLQELFDRYLAGVCGATGIAAKTARRNVNCVRQIFRHVHGQELTSEAIGRLPTTDFNAALLEKYKGRMLAAAGENRLRQDSAYVTINAAIRMSRSLFCKKLPDTFYKDIVLPDLVALFKVKRFKETVKGFSMPAADLVSKVRAAAVLLKQADPNAYLIYLLGLGVGLRPGETSHARAHWIETMVTPAGPQHGIRVQVEDDFRPKGKQERFVPLQADIHAELLELIIPTLPGTPDYILRGCKTERVDQAFRRFSAWLNNLGWDRKKKAHELRKMFGSYVTQQAGLRSAQDLLGHAQFSTTERYYVGQVDLPKYHIPTVNVKTA